MIKKILLILSTIALFSCGRYELQETFVPFVKKFEEEIGVKVNIKITFPPAKYTDNSEYTQKRILGTCVTVKNSVTQEVVEKYVEINPHFWIPEETSYQEKEFVLYHELGHCLLGRGHVSGNIYSNKYGWIPKSMMANMSFGNKPYYSEYRSYYVEELKNKTAVFQN